MITHRTFPSLNRLRSWGSAAGRSQMAPSRACRWVRVHAYMY